MYHKYLLPCIFLLSCATQANELVIPSGETYTVAENQRELRLKKLVIGDKVVIKFASGITYWDVRADHVEIGRDVVIDGRGANGVVGSPGAAPAARADVCQKGQRGNGGAVGGRGANGVDMEMRLHIVKMGSLTLRADGGDGGSGGEGGAGQQGGLATYCDPVAGGDGGTGGSGGEGGNGGKLMVSLTNGGGEGLLALSHHVEASAESGQGAVGGKAGAGGVGSEGKYVNQKTLTGDRKWVSGGKAGNSGAVGEKGRDGQDGRVFIGGGDVLTSPVKTVAVKEPVVVPAGKDELSAMQQRMDALERRIQALEGH